MRRQSGVRVRYIGAAFLFSFETGRGKHLYFMGHNSLIHSIDDARVHNPSDQKSEEGALVAWNLKLKEGY